MEPSGVSVEVTKSCTNKDHCQSVKATPKPTHERHNARAMGNQTIAPPLTVIQHLLD